MPYTRELDLAFFEKCSTSFYPLFSSWEDWQFFMHSALATEEMVKRKLRATVLTLTLPLPQELKAIVGDALNSPLSYPLAVSLRLPEKFNPQINFSELLSFFGQKKISFLMIDPSQAQSYDQAPALEEALRELQKNDPLPVYFLDHRLLRDDWNAKTKNALSGPKYVDVDVSNFCTHNCTFCGLYAPAVAARAQEDPQFANFYQKFTKERLSSPWVLDFLRELPLNISEIQLGGAGDPFTHAQALDFIQTIRHKNIRLSVLTNGAYFKPTDFPLIQKLSGTKSELHFFINLSAATAHTYQKVRPNQGAKTWEKIVHDLPQLPSFTLMCVLTKDNFLEAPQFVALAHQLGARDVWFKPLEEHGEHTRLLQIEDPALLKEKMKEALALAQDLGVAVFDRGRWEEQGEVGPQNPSLDYYSSHPCQVGLEYMRITTAEEIYPCCVMGRAVGKIESKDFLNSWLSPGYEDFRHKTGKIHQEHFHLKDPAWDFCRHCPHLFYNQVFEQLRAIPTPPGDFHFFRSLDQ